MKDPRLHSLFAEASRCHAAGEQAAAERLYRQVLHLDAGFPEALYGLGRLALETRRFGDALALLEAAVRRSKKNAGWFFDLGRAQEALGRLEHAASSFRRALALQPDLALAHWRLGQVHRLRGERAQGLGSLRRASALAPGNVDVLCDLGSALREARSCDEAIGVLERAVSLEPHHAYAQNNLGNALLDAGRAQDAMACFERAIALQPDFARARWNRARTLLLLGRLPEAWREHEWRIQAAEGRDYIPDPRDPSKELPRPSSLLPLDLTARRLLLVWEQGLGDELLFLRYAALARRKCAWVGYLGSPRLVGMLQRVACLDAVYHAVPPRLAADHILLVGDLPLILDAAGLSEIPAPLPLTPHPDYVARIAERLALIGTGPFLGVTWRAGIQESSLAQRTLYKSVDPGALGRLLAGDPRQVVVLQREPARAEMEQFSRALGRPAADLSALNQDLEAMLALLDALDEYVGVSNTNMHLRAGLGKGARVLATDPPDFRLTGQGDTSPWFPGFKVYRKDRRAGWARALEQLALDLAA